MQSRSASRTGHTGREEEDSQRDEKEDSQVEGEGGVGHRASADWQTLRHCAEIVSLCRVRDAMGPGMEAMMGYLRYVYPLLS